MIVRFTDTDNGWKYAERILTHRMKACIIYKGMIQDLPRFYSQIWVKTKTIPPPDKMPNMSEKEIEAYAKFVQSSKVQLGFSEDQEAQLETEVFTCRGF